MESIESGRPRGGGGGEMGCSTVPSPRGSVDVEVLEVDIYLSELLHYFLYLYLSLTLCYFRFYITISVKCCTNCFHF